MKDQQPLKTPPSLPIALGPANINSDCMTAFASLIFFIIIAVLSMSLVAYSNYKVEQAKQLNARLQKYKNRVEELEDIVLALDQLCEKRIIPKLINDEVMELYETMIELDPKTGYLQAGYSNAKMRSDELSDESVERNISRMCNSDAQIARMQAYLNEAVLILRKQHNQGKVSAGELQSFTLDIEWLYLQVNVISNIGQGHKAYSRQDILTANAFYKKAQADLVRSNHPDERRHKMIKQMTEILFARRKALDTELMPEDEFNPQNTIAVVSEEEQQALNKLLTDDNAANNPELAQLTEALLAQNHTDRHNSPSP
ncbi:MAG: hypothetical protein KTR20_02050 [Cellvibrionaceae bacterium]|nr:hypothetical protein [Cellvibrionaceae bacterium]